MFHLPQGTPDLQCMNSDKLSKDTVWHDMADHTIAGYDARLQLLSTGLPMCERHCGFLSIAGRCDAGGLLYLTWPGERRLNGRKNRSALAPSATRAPLLSSRCQMRKCRGRSMRRTFHLQAQDKGQASVPAVLTTPQHQQVSRATIPAHH